MSLFDNQREANLDSTVAMVEDVLIELGHFVNDCRSEREGAARAWALQHGSATIDIGLLEREGDLRLRVSATVLTLDGAVDRPALFGRLLALNAEAISGAAFALEADHVLLLGERTTVDLDRSEVLDLVSRVQRYADEHDDALVREFGGTPGRH